MNKPDIRDLSHQELIQYLERNGEKPFRASQIFTWIYQKGVKSFDEMRNLPAGLITKFKGDFVFESLIVVEKQISKDHTTKFLFNLADNEKIETVLIPTARRTTVCVSTQAGCKFACRFCASGIGGWQRNLKVSEILAQILHVKEEAKRHKKPLSHIVFMGTGENLDTYDNLLKAVRIINAREGLNIGARRITISTVGIIPKIRQLVKEKIQVELAISLHGYNEESRNKLMPVNKKYPFRALIDACREYIKSTNRQITFEYILIKDLTCSEKGAKELGRRLKGMLCKMNLIPYNPVKEFSHKTPSVKEMMAFRDSLKKYNIPATIRMPRGKDIAGACGQLRHTTK